jgi:hypothetical protein
MVPMMGDDGAPPKPTGRPAESVSLTGMLLMWKSVQPVLLRVAGLEGNCIPLFTTPDKLRDASRELGLHYESIKQVDDGRQFLDDMRAQNVRIIVDPHIATNGKLRYLDVRAM